MPELKLIKLESSFIPHSIDDTKIMQKMTTNAVYKARLVHPRLNTEDPTDEQRTTAQNRLMWMMLTDMQNTTNNEHSGTTKEDWHIAMKRKFLVPIYERDGGEFPHLKMYQDTLKALRSAYRAGAIDEVDVLLNHVADKASTTEASVKQFAEYLTCIERFCWSKGIWLRTDEGLRRLAINYDREVE